MGFMRDLLDSMKNTGESMFVDPVQDAYGYFKEPFEDGFNPMDILSTAGNILDAPRTFATKQIGTADYYLANLRHQLGLEDDQDWQNIQEAYARGGGREVWEDEIVGEMGRLQRGALDVVVDPLSWIGVGLVGKGAGAITGAGRAMQGSKPVLGKAIEGTGQAITAADKVLGAPDRYVFDPLVGAVIGKPLGAANRQVSKLPMVQRMKTGTKTTLAKWLELSPREQVRLKVNQLSDAADELLMGKQTIKQKLPLNPNAVSNTGISLSEASPDAMFATMQVRNQTTTNPVARSFLDAPTDPRAKSAILEFIEKRRGPTGGMGITADGMPEVRNVMTDMGPAQTWSSVADRQLAADYLAKMLIANAPPAGGWKRVMDGVDMLQRARAEYMEKYGLTNELFADLYRAAKSKVEKDNGIKLPDEVYAGMHPGGGGFNDLNPDAQGRPGRYSEADAENFVANTAAGMHTANYRIDREAEQAFERTSPEFLAMRDELADIIEHQGVAFEFTPDGLFYGEGSFRQLEGNERFGRSGLRIMTREQAYEVFQREFGALDQEVMDELYNEGAERFRQEMVRAVAPNREYGGKGNPLAKGFDQPDRQTDERLLGGLTQDKDYSYTKNRRLLMGREQADRFIEKGREGAGFYGQGIPELRQSFSSDEDFEWLIDLWVVTSSHTKLDANVTKALNAYLETGADGPRALRALGLDPESINDYVRANGMSIPLQEGEPTHRAAIESLMSGKDIGTQKLYSYKGSFKTEMALARQNMAHDVGDWNIPPEEVEILRQEMDTSLRRSAGVVTDDMWHQVANGLPTGPTGRQFEILEAASRQIARETGLMPHEVQAAVWSGGKLDFGNPVTAEGASDVSPANLVIYKVFGGGEDVTNPFFRYGTDTFPDHPTGQGVQSYTTARGEPALRETYTDMDDFKVRGAMRSFTNVFDRVSEAVTSMYGIAAREQTPIMLDFDDAKDGWLRGVTPDGSVKVAEFNPKKGKRQIRSSSMRKVGKEDKLAKAIDSGATIVDLAIPAGSPDEVALALFKTKYNVDPLLRMDWSGFRFVLDPTEEGTGMAFKLMWFPSATRGQASKGAKSMVGDILDGIPARKARFYQRKGISPGEVPASLEFEFAREFMQEVAATDAVSRGWFASKDSLKSVVKRQLDDILPNWMDNQIYTMELTPEGLVDVSTTPPARYAVALTSAGEAGSMSFTDKGASKMATDFIEEMLPIKLGANADRVRIGFFQDEESGLSSMDLTFFTDDPNLAEELGRMANQHSIFDTQAGESILTNGNSDSPYKTVEDLKELLAEIDMAESTGMSIADISIREGAVRDVLGATVGGTATRELPLREQLSTVRQKGESRTAFLKRMLAGSHTGGQAVATDVAKTFDYHRLPRTEGELLSTDEARKAAIQFNAQQLGPSTTGGYAWLDQEKNDLLYNTLFDDGTPVGDWVERTFDDLVTERSLLESQGITWDINANPPLNLQAKLALTSSKNVQDVIRKWHKNGLNMENTKDPMLALKRLLSDRLVAESGLISKKATFYSKAKALWSELALASPRYVSANLATNVLDATITGHFNYGSAMDVFRYAAEDLKGEPIERFMEGTKAFEVLTDKYGIGSNWMVLQNTAKKMTETQAPRSQARNVLKKIGLEKAALLVEAPRALALGVDINSRYGLFIDQMDSTFEAGRAELLGKIQAIADKAGVQLPAGELMPYYDPAKAFKYYQDAGFGDGYARRASREIAELRNAARKKAEEEVSRIALTYQKTNLDDALSKVIPFHYWASRKVRFYAEEAYRNPVLAANYARAVQGIDRAQDDPGLSARQKGFLRLMGGPTGFTLLMNPDGLLGVIKATGLSDQFTPDGQTEIGGIVDALKRNGVGLYPWIDGAINMLGVYGDTFEPDMLGIRHRALVASVVNWMRGEGLLGNSNREPGADPYAELNLEARERVSSWASTFLPDWLSQPVAANSGGGPPSTSLDQVIESRIIAENPDLTNAELVAIMNDPESEEYQSAFRDAARAGVIQQVLSFTAPVSFRVEENTRDVRNAKQELIRAQAEKKDVSPYELRDSHLDAQFRADYQRLTGSQFNASDWADAKLQEDLMRATRDARPFVLMENEYMSIGDDGGRDIIGTYYAILDGEHTPPGFRGDIRNASLEQREWLAERWLDTSGNRRKFDEVRAAQRAYKETHPEFAQFKDWQNQMYDLQALYGGSLAEYRRQVIRQNPSAAEFFAAQVRWMERQGVPPEQMEAELDRITASSNAWFAINGRPKTIYDADMSPGMGDPSMQMLQPYANTQYKPLTPPEQQPAAQPQLIGPGTNMYNVNQQPAGASQNAPDWTNALMSYQSRR